MARRSSSWRVRCARRAITVAGSRATVRRPFAVFGVPSHAGRSSFALHVGRDQSSHDAERAGVKIDVLPAQTECHAAPHAGVRQPPATAQAVSVERVEEDSQLSAGPGLHLLAVGGSGRVRSLGKVADERLPADRVAQGPVQDCGGLSHRPGAECAVLVVTGEQGAVRRVQLHGSTSVRRSGTSCTAPRRRRPPTRRTPWSQLGQRRLTAPGCKNGRVRTTAGGCPTHLPDAR